MNKIKLRIGGVPEHFNLPWRLTIESGSLQALNVDATWTDYHSGTGQMVKALNNDEVDVATLLTEGAIKAIASNQADFEILSFYTRSPLIWGIHTSKHSELTDLKAIKKFTHNNKLTFAISRYGSGSHLMAYLFAESIGINSEQLEFTIINDLNGALDLLKKGGNTLFLWEKFMTKPYVDTNEITHIDDFPTPWSCFVTCARKSVLREYPSTIENIMLATLKTANQLKKSKLASKLIAKDYGLKLADVETWLSLTKWQKKPKLDQKALSRIEEKLYSVGVLKR